jgi:hypothetical protein
MFDSILSPLFIVLLIAGILIWLILLQTNKQQLSEPGEKGEKGEKGDPGNSFLRDTNDVSVNGAAFVNNVWFTSARLNASGSYNGSGNGNKSIKQIQLLNDKPINALQKIELEWTNLKGPKGKTLGSLVSTTTPYVNLIVSVPGDGQYIFVCLSDQLPPVSDNTGTFTKINDESALFSFDAVTDSVFIVGHTGDFFGVSPSFTSGSTWLETVYSYADIVNNAVFPSDFPTFTKTQEIGGDGGLPKDQSIGSCLLISGDSGTTIDSQKRLERFEILSF